MDKKVVTVGVILYVIQICQAQPPNLAALLGLEGFGNLLGNMGGGNGGAQQSSGSSSCPYTAHADRRKFNQMVNNRVITQECAPGTMFVQSKCSCDNIPAGGNANGPMPGSNPRHQPSMGGGAGGNPMIAALMSQLDAAFAVPTRAPRPPPRNNSPMNTNELNAIRHKITSGIRPDQTKVGNYNKPPQKPTPAPNDIKYNLGSNTGLTSVVDPSYLPDVLPQEILNVLQGGNNALPSQNNNRQKPRPRDNQLPPSVQQMLERANKPPTKRSMPKTTPSRKPPTTKQPQKMPPRDRQYQPTKPPSIDLGMKFPPGGIPNDVLKMLQMSMNPPSRGSKRVKNNKTNAKRRRTKQVKAKSTKSRNMKQQQQQQQQQTRKQRPQKSQRRMTENRNAQRRRQDPLADLIAQMNTRRGQQKPTKKRLEGPRNDPLAALLGSVNQAPSRGTSRGSSRTQSNNQNRGRNRAPPSIGGVPAGVNPMAAMLAGLGGANPTATGTGGAGDPTKTLTSIMATMSGGVPSSNDMAALAIGLGGANPGGIGGVLPRLPGSTGYVDMTNFFNARGIMSGSSGGFSGLNNLDYLKLHTLDRHEVIDLGDLTPAGLLAANGHFANVSVPPYIPSGMSMAGLSALTNNAAGVNNAPPAMFG